MSTTGPAPPVARASSRIETCPYCGQQLIDARAVQNLRKSDLEFQRKLETAVRARVAELANELTRKLETEHQERFERLRGQPDVHEEQLATARAHHTEDLDVLRTFFRQF